MGDPQKVAAATSWIRRMLDFIHRHPDGYSEDDVIWLIKAWVMVGKNWTNTGNPESHGSKYGPFLSKWLLRDDKITADTPIVPSLPDWQDPVKPSQHLANDLKDCLLQVNRGHGYDYWTAFQGAEASMDYVLHAFRVMLARASSDRATRFRQSLAILRHQLQ